nr:hypothetical protein [Tanacetum cinerariifolium]
MILAMEVVKGSAIYGSDELNLMAKGGDGGAWVAVRWRSGEGGGKVMVLEMIDSLQALSNLHYLFGGFLDYLWKILPIVLSFDVLFFDRLSLGYENLQCWKADSWSSSQIYFVFFWELAYFYGCGKRCPVLNCYNLGGVNVNSLTINYVPEKLHDIDPKITFGELGT